MFWVQLTAEKGFRHKLLRKNTPSTSVRVEMEVTTGLAQLSDSVVGKLATQRRAKLRESDRTTSSDSDLQKVDLCL